MAHDRRRSRLVSDPSATAIERLESRLHLHHGDPSTHFHHLWIGGPGNFRDPAHWIVDNPSPGASTVPNPNSYITTGSSEITVSASDTFAFHSGVVGNIRLEPVALMIAHGNSLTLNGTLTFVGNNNGPTRLNFYAANGAPFTFDGTGSIATENGPAFISTRISANIGAGLTFNFGTNGGSVEGANNSLATINAGGGTVTLGGGSFNNRGTINLNGGNLTLSGPTWTNRGTINHNAGSLLLQGTWRQSDLGRHIRGAGTTVTAAGTLVGNLTLDATTGSWNGTGTLRNGRFTTRDGATFSSASTWDNYTLASDLTPIPGTTTVQNNLTLDGVTLRVNNGVTLRGLATTGTALDHGIYGTGRIELNNGTIHMTNVVGGNQVFTIGPEVSTFATSGSFASFLASQKYVLRGPITTMASGQSFAITARQVDLYGDISLVSGSFLFLQDSDGVFNILEGGSITTGSRSVFETARGFNLSSTDRGRTRSPGTFDFRGGTAAAPKLLEVAGKDLGPVSKGFLGNNFGIGVLWQRGAGLRLVDSSDNSDGPGGEALYADSLIINQAGYTLDLNGHKLYVRAMALNGGSIVNGTVTLVPDGGPLEFALPTSGRIAAAGETDDWTFFGRGGQKVSLVLNPSGNTTASAPGAISPILSQGKVTLLGPDGAVIATAQSPGQNGIAQLSNVALPGDGTYVVRVQASAAAANNTGHYKLSMYDVTVRRHPLLLNRVTTGNIDTPFAVDEWTFSLSAGQQVQFDLLNTANSGLRYTLTGPNGFVAFNTISGDSGLITIPGGNAGNFVLRVQGSTDETGAYSFLVRDTSVTPLTLGAPYAGVLPGSGSPQWFSVNLPSPGQLLVTLDDSTNTDRNQLYVRRGAPPTREVFDYRYTTYDADEQIYIPNATAGDWYVLVYGDHVPAPSTYTLKAEFSDLRITSNTPDRYGVENVMTMTITGGGFDAGTVMKLVGGATTIVASAVEVDLSTQVTATFDLAGAPQRAWDLVVERGAATFTKADAFTTLPNVPAKLETKLVMPFRPTRTSVTSGRIEYANTGNVAMPAPLLILQSGDLQGDQFPILSLDLTRQIEEFWSAALPPGTSHRLMVLGSGAVPGMLNPGEQMSIPYNYLGEKVLSDQDGVLELDLLCVHDEDGDGHAEGDGAGGAVDWAALKSALRPPGVPSAIWDRVYASITDPLDTIADYAAALVANAQYLGRLGTRVIDVDDIWNFQVQQALGTLTAVPTLASAIDAQLPAPGDPLTLARRFADGVVNRNAIGPFGYGWSSPWFARLTRDANNNVITIGTPSGGQRVFVRDARGSTPLTQSTTYFSPAGDPARLRRVGSNVFELRDPDGSLTRFRSDGKIDYSQDANGNRTTLSYNADGDLVTLAHSSGATINLGYSAAGRITSLTDSLGRSKAYVYDGPGEHLLGVTSPSGGSVNYTYEPAGSDVMKRHALLSEQTGGITRVYTYDAQGRIASTFVAGGAHTVGVSYSFGRITLTDGAGTGHLFFDHRLRIAKVTDPLGRSTRMIYDGNDRLTTIVLPDESRQEYQWCDCGSLASVTDELGHTVRTTRDPITRKLTSLTDANGNVSRFTYDAAGNQLSLVYPDGSSEYVGSYAAGGLPLSFTTRGGKTTTVVYNAAGQVTRRTAPDGAVADYVYDARGRLTSITQGGQTITRMYDTANLGDRLKRITYPGGRFVEYDYDALGRRIAERDQAGNATQYEYDAAGRLAHVRDTGGTAISTYMYDAAGRLARVDHANGTYTTYAYDAAGKVLTVEHRRAGGALNSRFAYTYDPRGRRTSAVTTDGTWTYTYDAAGQLRSADFASVSPDVPNQSMEFKYDAAGNRTFATINGVLHDYGINNMNQYTQVDGVPLTYDADGNLVSDGSRQFTYDAFNRLVQVQAGGDTQQFEYNAAGGRSASILNGVRTNYLVAPDITGRVLAEYDAAGAVQARYVHGDGLTARADAAGALGFYDFDLVGSTAGMSDSAGNYANRYVYDPFGRSLFSSETIANAYEFTGQSGGRSGHGGLTRMGFRDYAADLGRFTTVDGLRLADRPNAYQYAGNNPVMNFDPTGLFIVSLIPAGGKNLFTGLAKAETDFLGDLTFSVGVDGWQGLAVAAQTGNMPSLQDAGWGVLSSFALNAGFSAPGLNGFASGFQVAMDPEVNQHFVNAACGLALQRQFGSINIGAAKQLAALEAETGGSGPNTVNPDCLNGFPTSGEADMGVGDPCAQSRVLLNQAQDPNEKKPPTGFGPDNRVAVEMPVEYTVDFENIGPGSKDENGDPYPVTAGAAAQRVAIDDRLSPHFDWSSVRFTEFAFGATIVPVANGYGSFSTTVPVVTDGVSYAVQIDAFVDLDTGVLSVIFQAVDPLTGLPPPALVGVVQPENGSGNGMGHVKFSVAPLATVPDGTPIRNIAYIQFDANDVIPTNQVNPLDPTQGTSPAREALVTIDAAAPAVVGQPQFLFDAPTPRVTIQFSEDVQASLSAGSVQVFNLTTSSNVAPTGFSWAATGNTATFTFDPLLPDGNYLLTLPAGAAIDGVGRPLQNPVMFAFFHISGDANRDRTVGIADFAALAAHFNQGGSFTQGDFNYSGTVEIGDFSILASKFNTTLPAPGPTPSAAVQRPSASSPAADDAGLRAPSPADWRRSGVATPARGGGLWYSTTRIDDAPDAGDGGLLV